MARLRRAVADPSKIIHRVRSLNRGIPHGLFANSFFLNGCDPHHRLHRKANLAMRGSWPVPVWVLVQIWLAIRWQLASAEKETNRAVALYGSAVEAREGLSQSEQRRIVLDLARRYCIPPLNAYEFRLYRQPEAALAYIFTTEIKGLHRAMNGRTPHWDEATLQDKAVFAARAIRTGLPCIETLTHLSKGQNADVSTLATLDTRGVFLKSRTGSRGIGAFALRQRDGSLEGRMLDGRPLKSAEAAMTALHTMLAKDDVLVQPHLANHPLLKRATSSGDAAILRITTRRRQEGADILAAFLRLPIRVQARERVAVIDVVARVDPETGVITRNPDSVLALLPQTSLLEDRVFQQLPEETAVPFWPEIVAQSRHAQAEFAGLWAIGWDWIVSANGPFLLEGNVYWDTKRPQEVAGGLVPNLLELADA